MELDNERLLKAVVSQDVMYIVQKESAVDTSDLQTELERTKERFENCIIKKETEYAKLWNDWYKKCNECKYDKISYDKAYKDMQQKIERLQAQLGDLNGMFRISPNKISREAKKVPNTVNASSRTKLITVSQPHVITKKDVNGLSSKGEHLCPSCEQGKRKRATHPPKPVPNSMQRLHLLHVDLCGPMRIASINGKRYVLVIVDDYSRYTWVHFLRSKDEAPVVIIKFLKRITVLLQSPVIIIRTDNGTKFKNQVLKEYFDSVGISYQMSSVRTSQQNGVVNDETGR
nr:putative ribonuclease H-like domain-containing protein [Tanacetum cinerariifolium]